MPSLEEVKADFIRKYCKEYPAEFIENIIQRESALMNEIQEAHAAL